MDDFDRGAMLETFIHEMGSLVDQLEDTMIQAGEVYTSNTINEIFRIMHTIKGSASMMLFTALADVTHSAEDLFFYLREHNPQNVDYPHITDLVLEVVDFIKLQLSHLSEATELDDIPGALVQSLSLCLGVLKGDGGASTSSNVSTNKADAVVSKQQSIRNESGGTRYGALVFFQDGSEMENVRAFTIIHHLQDVATDIVTVPEDVLEESSIWQIRESGLKLEFTSHNSLENVKDVLMQSIYIKDLQLETIGGSSASKGNNFEILIRFQEESQMENVRAFALVNNLPDSITVLKQVPGDLIDENSRDVVSEHGFKLIVSTMLDKQEVEDILADTIYLEELVIIEVDKNSTSSQQPGEVLQDIANISEVPQNEEILAPNSGEVAPLAQVATSTQQLKDTNDNNKENKPPKKAASHAISVNVNKLDQLLNLVGELVISEAMVTQNPELEGLELESFTKESRQLRKIITEIQYNVMSMRMVPLSPTFFKMHRIVRDMCRQLNKNVALEVIGDDTEVDKNIIEHIADPLMHIIRNSVDHGIENPDIRNERGKNEQGTVTLEAKNSGGDVLIIIKDDGAGLNKDKILTKARNNGLLIKPEDEYTDKEIFQFIFMPGFSTNENVTSFSGRGVGMDVVNTNLEHVGGTVIVDSVEGEGSSTTLKIPLTLAIIDGMLIKIGDAKYTIPIMDIRRSLKVTEKDIVFDPSNNEMVRIRGEVYNLLRLNRFFGLDTGYDNIEDGIVLMLENGDNTVCVFADELVGEQQIVVKNIPKYIKKVHGLSGCTLLGNGDISLIINVAAFFGR